MTSIGWKGGRRSRAATSSCAAGEGKQQTDVIPPPFNARTRVHEYGGGSWTVADGTVYFSNFADGRLYRLTRGAAEPQALTPAPPAPGRQWRFADGVIDRRRNRWIGVREDHTGRGRGRSTPSSRSISAMAGEPGRVLAGGHDFFCSPRLSADGNRLAWLAWDHPNMPWNGTTLYLADVADEWRGRRAAADRRRDGGIRSSSRNGRPTAQRSCSCRIAPAGGISTATISRRGRRGRWRRGRRSSGVPQWQFGASTYAFAGPDRIVCAYSEDGLGKLAVLDLASASADAARPAVHGFRLGQGRGRPRGVPRRRAETIPPASSSSIFAPAGTRVLKKATEILDRAEPRIADYLTKVESVEFPTTGGKTAFGLFYPPANPDYAPPAGEKPPLLVKVPRRADLGGVEHAQSGHAILDQPRHRGAGRQLRRQHRVRPRLPRSPASDLGRGRRRRLRQRRQVSRREGRVDGKRCVISGGSAGGYTTLAALAFRDFFQGGASYYGVSDVAALARDTHKFESRYLDWLIGPYPQEEALYRERSPVFHAERLSKPVIFFQGDEDAVVPPNQAEVMVEALRRNGNPVGYFLFAGEQHGFRKAGNIQRCLDAELVFLRDRRVPDRADVLDILGRVVFGAILIMSFGRSSRMARSGR